MKLNSRSSLDPRWTRHHIVPVVGFMLAEIKVYRKNKNTKPQYNQSTGKWTGGIDTVISSVKARIQPFGINGDMVVGQDTTARRYTRVQIEDVEAGILVDDMIEVLSCPDNPELVGFTIEVRGSLSSSNAWVTDLVCEVNQKADL